MNRIRERIPLLSLVFCLTFPLAPAFADDGAEGADAFEELAHLDAEAGAASVPSLAEFTAPCPGPVDPKQVDLFIDTNSAYREVQIAKQAACAAGRRFESLPSLEAIYHSGVPMETLSYARDRKGWYEQLCKKSPEQCDPARLKAVVEEFNAAEKAAAKAGAEQAYVPAARFRETIARLAAEQARVRTLVVSGHHYEYAFYGDYLTPERFHDDEYGPYGSDVAKVAREYPQVFTTLDAIGMWGCAGVTLRKVEEWRRYFPSVRLMAGYNNTAPSSTRPDNLAYLKGFLSRIPALLAVRDATTARARIAAIPAIHTAYAGVYLRLPDGGDYLYQVTAPRSGSAGARWTTLATKSHCDAFLARLPGWVERLKQYENGLVAIPEDNDGSELKRIYFDLQINGDCYKDRPEAAQYNSPRVGLLRFFESGLKINFAASFQAELDAATTELGSAHYRAETPPAAGKTKKGAKSKPAPSPRIELLDIQAGPALELLANRGLTEFLLTEPRARILALETALAGVAVIPPSRYEIGTRAIARAQLLIRKLLVELRPDCTEMLIWHQPRTDHPPALSCRI